MTSAAPSHPILRYHGGKWRLAPWVISHFPAHDVYVEPFAGAASVLMRKPPSRVEVYNDLYGRVVNLFRVLRDPAQAGRLARLCELTPYAEEEFAAAHEVSPDAIEDARRMLVLGAQAHGSNGPTGGARMAWRRGVRNRGCTTAIQWAGISEDVEATARRLRGVFIEHAQDALTVIRRWDAPEALFYVDPPYVQSSREASTARRGYAHEYSDAQHRELLDLLMAVKGRVAISGYPNALYDEALSGWVRVSREALADKGARRTEVLWLNYDPPARLNFEGQQ